MEKNINKVDIIPAKFIKYRDDGNILLKCMQGDETVERAFEPHLFIGIINIKYILIGIITGVQNMQLIISDGTEFEEMFLDKWNILNE